MKGMAVIPDLQPVRSWRSLVAFAALCLFSVCGALAAGTVTEEVRVTGAVKTPLDMKVSDLRAFPADQIVTVSLSRKRDGQSVSSTVRGVRLTALLDRAEFVATNGNDWRRAVVVADSSDGYRVTFSWPELFNTEVGAGVLVVFERDGQALADSEGRIALVSSRDLRSGPRSVKWLTRIDVRVLKD
jgi:DMSO/TMAO reductase YedYZ molybdopterin-dependent catalytic subunit